MEQGIYVAYFTSSEVLTAIIISLAALLVLYAVFRIKTSPRVRSSSLGLMMLSSIFLWLFIGVSLVACYWYSTFSDVYEHQLATGVRIAFGTTLLVAIAGAIPLAFLLRHNSPRIVLAKVKDLSSPRPMLANSFRILCEQIGIDNAQLKISATDVPVSFAIDSKKPTVVMSENLVHLLDREEVEGVLAHELAHIKNSDTSLKAMMTAYKTTLPHDPIIRLVEAAFHRERELAADATAAKLTGKPLSLASALLKIYEKFPSKNLGSYGTLSILGGGKTLMSRHPPIRQRINQLIRLADTYK